MKAIIYIVTGLFSLYIIDFITSRKLMNRYKMYGIFGKPGSGKSTYLTMTAYKEMKKGWEVFTDDPSVNIPGVKHFDSEKFKRGEWLPDGRKNYPKWWNTTKIDPRTIEQWKKENREHLIQEQIEKGNIGEFNKENKKIVLIFDEIGSLYNNRDFKNNLTPDTLKWWKEHRHKRVKIYYGSQSYKDMDLKIRQLSDQLYIIKRGVLKNFAVAKPILINFDIMTGNDTENQNNAGGQIIEAYKYDIFIFWKPILLRKWIKKFDSYR